jgi:hypothetical protein
MKRAAIPTFIAAPAVLAGLMLTGPGLSAGTPDRVLEAGPETRTQIALTVYNSDLALVREARRLDLPAGRIGLRLAGVPDGIEARSVQVEFTGPEGVRVLEQNLLSDLITPQRVLELWVGEPLTLVFDEGDGEERRVPATLLSTNGGLVFRTEDEVLLDPTARIALPRLPADLLPRPLLEWQLDVRRAGERELRARYLTRGLSWSADYVATLDDESGHLRLGAWVTVENRTQTSFDEADLQLVAGEVHRVSPARQVRGRNVVDGIAMEAVAAPPPQQFQQQALGDYHLYALERPASLGARSSKQIALRDAGQVPFTRRYVVTSGPRYIVSRRPGGDPQERPVEVRVEFLNSDETGLGAPLPAGIVRLYAPPAEGGGEALFVGEDRVPHTAVDETVSLTAGRSFDLVAERLQTDHQERRRGFEAAFEIRLRNRRDEAARIQVRETVPGDWTVLESSHPFEKRDVSTIQFDMDVPAGAEVVLTYRVRVSY